MIAAERVTAGPVTPCRQWTGRGIGPVSAAKFKLVLATIYELHHETLLPFDAVLVHRCGREKCIEPSHLVLLGDGERVDDIEPEFVYPVSRSRVKSHCIRGHEMTGPNLYVAPDGSRSCNACRSVLREQKKARARR